MFPESRGMVNSNILVLFSLVSFFEKKKRLIKWAAGVCVCVSMCVCLSVYNFGPPLSISKPVIRLIRNFGYI